MRRGVYNDPTDPETIENLSEYDLNVNSIESPFDHEEYAQQPDESYVVSLDDDSMIANIYHSSELSRATFSKGSNYFEKVDINRNDIPELVDKGVESLLEP